MLNCNRNGPLYTVLSSSLIRHVDIYGHFMELYKKSRKQSTFISVDLQKSCPINIVR